MRVKFLDASGDAVEMQCLSMYCLNVWWDRGVGKGKNGRDGMAIVYAGIEIEVKVEIFGEMDAEMGQWGNGA